MANGFQEAQNTIANTFQQYGFTVPSWVYGGPMTSATTTPTYSATGTNLSSVDPTQIAQQTAAGNLGAAASNTQLATLINEVNQAAQQAANASRLGPEGQGIQNLLLQNTAAQAGGMLDPTTEQMLRSNIAQRYGAAGMGVDSPALASAYLSATGRTVEDLQNQGMANYLQLLSANPSAPIFNMGDLITPSSTYAQAASAEAARQQAAQQFAQTYALQQQQLQQQAQQAADQLAYQYYAANLRSGGYGGSSTPSASAWNTRAPAGGTDYGTNPFNPYQTVVYGPQESTTTSSGNDFWYTPPAQTVTYAQPNESLYYSPTADYFGPLTDWGELLYPTENQYYDFYTGGTTGWEPDYYWTD